MKRVPSVLFCSFTLLLLFSCSIKEDRNECPCILQLNFVEKYKMVQTDVVLDFHASDGSFRQTKINILKDSIFEFKVPRTDLVVNAYAGDEGLMGQDGLSIPLYKQCPALYMSSLKVNTKSEKVSADVNPYKNYCNIELCFEDAEKFRYEASIRGDYCGYDIDGSSKKGVFLYELNPDTQGRCQVRVPRQEDGSLTLVLKDTDGYEKNFAIGEYIIESGFDWKSKSLKDILVEIDYARTMLVFKIEGWEKSVSFDVVI